jgi:hypothetical protein
MVYTKTLLPGESQCQNSSGKCPSSPTFTWRSFLRLRAQSQPEVVGSSERGCNSSASASVTQAGHLRPLDVRRRGFGLLPDGQGLEELNRAEWASRIPLRLRVQKGGILKWAVQKRVRSMWGSSTSGALGVSQAVNTEDSKIRGKESDRHEPSTLKRTAGGRCKNERRGGATGKRHTHEKAKQQRREKGFFNKTRRGNGRGESVASYPFPELEHALVEMICPLARVPRPGHPGHPGHPGLRLPSILREGPSSIFAVSSRAFWAGAFRSTWVPTS